jgi:hypothetical protein
MAKIQSALVEQVCKASLEEKSAILNELIHELAHFDASPIVGVAMEITDEADRIVGWYYPINPDEYAKCPPLSYEEVVDYLRRSDSIARDSIPIETLLGEINSVDVPSAAR